MTWVAPLQVDEVVHVAVYDSATESFRFVGAKVKGKQVGFNPVRPGWIAVELLEDCTDYSTEDVITRAASMLYRTRPVTYSQEAQKSDLEQASTSQLPEVRVDRYRIVPDRKAGEPKGT